MQVLPSFSQVTDSKPSLLAMNRFSLEQTWIPFVHEDLHQMASKRHQTISIKWIPYFFSMTVIAICRNKILMKTKYYLSVLVLESKNGILEFADLPLAVEIVSSETFCAQNLNSIKTVSWKFESWIIDFQWSFNGFWFLNFQIVCNVLCRTHSEIVYEKFDRS